MTGSPRSPGEAFASIPYLRALPPADQSRLAMVCRSLEVPRGSRLFEEGGEPAGIFLIRSGRIKLVRSSAGGREQVLHEEGAGSTLAEVPVFDGGGYVASAIAAEDAVVVFVPRQPLLTALSSHPACMLEVIRLLAGRVRKFAVVVEDLSLRSVNERVAGFLVAEMDRAGRPDFDLPPTREDLAAHVGTVREQASRALSELKAARCIDVAGRRVRVLAPDRLRAMAGRAGNRRGVS
jgi:CRP/FNR family transcriptional regulator